MPHGHGMRPAIAIFMLLVACAHAPRLVPAPEAQRVPNDPSTAVAAAAGVEVYVNAQQWDGIPPDLPSIVTPVYVTIANRSDAPVLVRYRDFTLTGPSGLQTAAIPPLHIQRPGTAVAVVPRFGWNRFLVFRPYGPFYPTVPMWGGPFDYDPLLYDQLYGSWKPPLPSPDMLNQAVPEGVLQPGGQTAGFLYFHRLEQNGRVLFVYTAVDATTSASIATLHVPMTLQ
jgi:hypothetical protein